MSPSTNLRLSFDIVAVSAWDRMVTLRDRLVALTFARSLRIIRLPRMAIS